MELLDYLNEKAKPKQRAKASPKRARTWYERARKFVGSDRAPVTPRPDSARSKQQAHAKIAAKHSR